MDDAVSGRVQECLKDLPAEARRVLTKALAAPDFEGAFTAEDFSLVQESGISMLALLPLASCFARPEISRFRVGAVLRGSSGRIYLGSNLEFAGQSLAATVHAEQSAAANAYMQGEVRIEEIAVSAHPCGLCRQFLWEMSNNLTICLPGAGAKCLQDLLPHPFGPRDLGFTTGALPRNRVSLNVNASPDSLLTSALEAAQMSYAPYTSGHAGIAISTKSGRMFRGTYIENAAFNPSLPPLQAALSALAVSGNAPAEISGAVLVETNGGQVKHSEQTRQLLAAIAPSAHFTTIQAVLNPIADGSTIRIP